MNRPITLGKRLRWLTWALGLLAILFSGSTAGLAARRLGQRRLPVAIAVVDLAIVAALFTRGLDIRMLLLLGALPLFAVTGRLAEMVVRIAGEMANAWQPSCRSVRRWALPSSCVGPNATSTWSGSCFGPCAVCGYCSFRGASSRAT